MKWLFYGDINLKMLNLANFNMRSADNLALIFDTDTALQTLTLGKGAVLQNDTLNVSLPAVPTNATYLGRWINTEGQTFTSPELMALYSADGTGVADTYTWLMNKSSLAIKDTTLVQTLTNIWHAKDNLISATDDAGQALNVGDLKVTGTVDTTTPGTYQVTYQNGDFYSGVATITVLATKVSVKANDMTVIQGQPWRASDNFKAATDATGRAVDFSRVTVTGDQAVDTSKVGATYAVTYRYQDVNGNPASQTVTITVIASQVGIDAKAMTLTQGQSWQPADSFVSATDATGQPVDFKQVTVLGADQVNTQVPGQVQVTYQYTDAYQNLATKTVTLTVLKTQAAVDAKNMTIIQNAAWQPSDSFVSATSADGQSVDFSQVKVLGADKVDLTKPGQYQVTYQYTDSYGNNATKTVTLTVIKTKATVNAKDMTVMQNGTWQPSDSFISATDATGKTVAFSQVQVIGADKVDLDKPGQVQVTYRYTDAYHNVVTKTVTVTVKAANTTPTTEPATTPDNGGQTVTGPDKPTTDAAADHIAVTPTKPDQPTVAKSAQTATKGRTTTTWQGAKIDTKPVITTSKSVVSDASPVATQPVKLATTTTVQAAKISLAPTKSKAAAKPVVTTSLPQTSDQTAASATGLGLLLLGLSSLTAFFGRKRREH